MSMSRGSGTAVKACRSIWPSMFTRTVANQPKGSHMADNDPHILETEKQKSLKGESKSPLKNTPGWNEKLASDAEAAVKADREIHDDEEHHDHIKNLQDHSAKHIEDHHGHSHSDR